MNKQLRDLIEIIHFTEKVSTKMHGLLDEAKVYRAVKEEFAKSKKYTASILLLTNEGAKLRIVETSMSPEEIKAGERIAKLRLMGHEIDLNKSSIYSQVVREGKTIQAKVSDIISELFPRPMAFLISKTLGYKNRESILTPLKRNGEIIGALAMTSTDLVEYLIPSVKNLAQHISTALELAYECAEHKKTGEALRKAHKELEKRVEERTKELQESEKRFRTLAQTATDAIITVDSRGDIIFWNRAAETIFGYSAHEAIGRSLTLIIPKRFLKTRHNLLQRVVTTGKAKFIGKTNEFFGLRKDGSEFPLELSLASWNTRQGIFFTGIARDITDRKRAEEALRKSRKRLKAYSESLEKTVEERTEELSRLVESQKEFIADISHELRTPLSVIKAVAETELDNDSAVTVQQFSLVDKKVDQITRILKNLMLVSRLDIGQEQIKKTTFKIGYLLNEVLEDVVKETHREGIDPDVKISCSKDLKLRGDRTKMSVVMTNLLRNAVVHSNGKPRIFLKAKKRGDEIQIVVKDNNQPIPKKELKKIFERFYRIKQARRKTESSGLGLYISQRLVELMRGKIWAESKKGVGNKFIVQLPHSS